MLYDNAKMIIMPIWLSMVSRKPEWRCVCQSKNSQGKTIAKSNRPTHSQGCRDARAGRD